MSIALSAIAPWLIRNSMAEHTYAMSDRISARLRRSEAKILARIKLIRRKSLTFLNRKTLLIGAVTSDAESPDLIGG